MNKIFFLFLLVFISGTSIFAEEATSVCPYFKSYASISCNNSDDGLPAPSNTNCVSVCVCNINGSGGIDGYSVCCKPEAAGYECPAATTSGFTTTYYDIKLVSLINPATNLPQTFKCCLGPHSIERSHGHDD